MASVTVIKGNIVTPLQVLYGGQLVVVNDIIRGIFDSSTEPMTDAQLCAEYDVSSIAHVEGDFVLPGFVDIHNHGLGGHADVIGHWSNPEYSLKELARCGTLVTLASVIFSDDHAGLVRECIQAVETRVGRYIENCCTLGGIHAEGPVIHDRGGLPSCTNTMSPQQFKDLCASMPSMKVMTVSPHVDARDGYPCIRHLLDIGVRPALGHDRVATKRDILGALRLCKTEEQRLHATHMCNVMSFQHRSPSLVNVCLCSEFPKAPLYGNARPPTVEIIADLVHVDSLVVQSVLSSRKPGDVAIITDCISENKPGKRVVYNGRESVVRAEGACVLCDSQGRPSNTLAGGISMLADQFYTLLRLFHEDVVSACLHTATVPARVARLHDVGSLEVGKKANLLVLDTNLRTIEKRMIQGRWTTHEPYRILQPSVAHM